MSLSCRFWYAQEVTERTGINPSFSYMSIACPKRAELAMLAFSKQQVGKPFSMIGMARSVCWPRKTTCKDWYCAELVAAVMQVGGLIDAAYNPGAATPENLYRRFHGKFATAANPFVLNKLSSSSSSVSSRSSRSCSTAVATALTAASTPGRLQPVKWHGHAQRMNVSQLSAAEQQQQSASTMFAISPWQLKMDAPKSALGTQDELEPLMKHRIGYRVTTAGGAAGGAAGGGHVYRGRTNTAESIRCAVLRAGVLSHPQADLSMGGLYDRV